MPGVPVNDFLHQALNHHRAGRLDLAEAAYQEVLNRDPQNPSALHHLGVLARQQGRLPQAVSLMRRSVELQPSALDYRKNLAATYRAQGLFEQARAELVEVLAREPNDAIARDELGLVLDKLGLFEEAVEEYRRALNLFRNAQADPRQISRTYLNLGSGLARLGRYEESLAAADEAVKFREDYPLAHINRSHALFRLGRLPEAWREYEWRWRRDDFTQKWPDYSQPVWDGSALEGKRLLLWHEQGLGDTVQFCRFAPMAARQGGQVSVICQPELRRLLSTLSPDVEIVASGQSPPPFDVHLSLMSLPRIFQTSLQTIPSPGGYLRADPSAVSRWKEKVQAVAPKMLRVGIVWSGSPTHANERNRSIPLSTYSPLMTLDNIAYFILQKGDAASQLHEFPHRDSVVDWTDKLHDFAETAALMSALDLVVSVDTSVCHVAGAIGIPTFTLIPFEPDFRYLSDDQQSSWYTSMRLFRQPKPGDWTSVVQRVADALRQRAANRP